MPAIAREITFTKKKSTGQYIARFRMPDGRRIERLTGTTKKNEAVRWATNWLESKKQEEEAQLVAELNRQKKAREITFREYSCGFFDWEGPYSLNRRSSGKRLSEYQCRQKAHMLEQTVLPELGGYQLREIKTKTVREFRNRLFLKGKSGQTINQHLSVIKAVLEAAADDELIDTMPRIEKAAINAKTRGILTPDEAHALIYEAEWNDRRARVATMIAISCGLRLSEILGLRPSCFDENSRTVAITASYCHVMRRMNTTTKNGKPRVLPVPDITWNEVQSLIAENPHCSKLKNPFIFYASSTVQSINHPATRVGDHMRPMEEEKIRKGFYAALKTIEIDDTIRRQRGIVFHSTRHFFNTHLIDSGISDVKVRALTGHSSAQMTQTYYHPNELADIKKAQDNILSNPKLLIAPK